MKKSLIERENKFNLIDVAVDEDEFLKLYAFPGKDYIPTFGNEFLRRYESELDMDEEREQNEMLEKYGHPVPLVTLVFVLPPAKKTRVVDLISNYAIKKQETVPCDLLLKGDAYLLSFYVLAKISEIPKTPSENVFYRGIGHALLCWALKNVPQLKDKQYITLHANAGDTPEENAPLVKYYEKLGFVRCLDAKDTYELLECMIGSSKTITERCDLYARQFITPLRTGR